MKQKKKTRRFNGQGSVYKLNDTRRKKPWVAVVTEGYELQEGKPARRIPKLIGCFESESEAKDALDKYRLLPEETKSTMTLKQAYNAWSGVKFQEDITKSTKDGILAAWKRLSKLENRVFSELRSDQFQEILNEAKNVEKVSKSTLNKLKALIHALCEYAYHNNIISKDFSMLVKVGKVEETEREAFTEAEVEVFKENIDKVPYADTILVLCYTGMRPIEMLTLKAENVDMENKTIIGGVKTDAGKNRLVPIHHLIYPIFEKWIALKGETIFCNTSKKDKGKPLSVRAYREKRFIPALEEMKVRVLDTYSCRHTFATRMNRANAPPANVQKLIGHVVGSDTKDKVYTHPEIEDLRNTIELLK